VLLDVLTVVMFSSSSGGASGGSGIGRLAGDTS